MTEEVWLTGHELEQGSYLNRRSDVYPNALTDGVSTDEFPAKDDSDAMWNGMEVVRVSPAGTDGSEEMVEVKDLRTQMRLEISLSTLEDYVADNLIGVVG